MEALVPDVPSLVSNVSAEPKELVSIEFMYGPSHRAHSKAVLPEALISSSWKDISGVVAAPLASRGHKCPDIFVPVQLTTR